MEIRAIKSSDIATLEPMARRFVGSSEVLAGEFSPDHFAKMWSAFIDQGIGAIFVLEDEGVIVGGLGAIAFPDMHTGNIVSHECFWFVAEESRGEGLKLLDAFEAWAKSKESRAVIVTHLADSMPERVARIYRMRGYRLIETNYRKEVH